MLFQESKMLPKKEIKALNCIPNRTSPKNDHQFPVIWFCISLVRARTVRWLRGDKSLLVLLLLLLLLLLIFTSWPIWKMWVYVMISVRPPADCPFVEKIWRCDFLGHYKHDKCQTLHDGTPWALPNHTTFSDLDCISRSQQR